MQHDLRTCRSRQRGASRLLVRVASVGLCRRLVHEPSAIAREQKARECRSRCVIAIVLLCLKFCRAIVESKDVVSAPQRRLAT